MIDRIAPRLFTTLLILLLPGAAFAAEDADTNAAFTGYLKMVEAVFPPTQLMQKNREPTRQEARFIEGVRSGAFNLIDAAGMAWYSAAVGGAVPNADEMRAIRAVMRATPVWVCRGDCTGCSEPFRGCVLTRKFANTVASVILLPACFLKTVGCPSDSTSEKYDIQPAVAASLALVAFGKLNGDKRSNPTPREAAQRATSILGKSIQILKRLTGACPGPFPQVGAEFLWSTGHLRDIGAFAERCGERLIAPLSKLPTEKACSLFLDSAKYRKLQETGVLGRLPKVQRCDAFCESLTCGGLEPKVRLLQLGSRWVLSLPEGECEGAQPLNARKFVEEQVRAVARDDMRSRVDSFDLFVSGCLKALVPPETQGPKEDESRPVELPEGVGVELIES